MTFNLYSNSTGSGTPLFTDANEPLVSGVATSAGYTATATGTDYWVATYNGDSNNASVTSGTALEPVTISPATPAINTSQQPASAAVGTLDRRQGHGERRLQPDRDGDLQPVQQLDRHAARRCTPTPTWRWSSGVATSAGYTATATGTDYWVATYNGDSNNASVTSGTALEPVTHHRGHARRSTPASSRPAPRWARSIADKATVSGGYSPTGTVTFNLYATRPARGTPLYTDANVPLVSGVATSAGYTATATGTDYWVATYNGDSNNAAVTSGTALEPVTITAATPVDQHQPAAGHRRRWARRSPTRPRSAAGTTRRGP